MTGMQLVNPTALRIAKTLWSFGRSECSRVTLCLTIYSFILVDMYILEGLMED